MILTNVRPTLADISPFFLPVPQHHDIDESFVQACHQTRRDLPYELTNALSQFAAGDSSGGVAASARFGCEASRKRASTSAS